MTDLAVNCFVPLCLSSTDSADPREHMRTHQLTNKTSGLSTVSDFCMNSALGLLFRQGESSQFAVWKVPPGFSSKPPLIPCSVPSLPSISICFAPQVVLVGAAQSQQGQ